MSQYNLALISHEVDRQTIYQRASDGYVNATAMCEAAEKRLGNYLQNQNTKAFIAELSRSAGIPADLLVQTINTGPNEHRGTWVHPDVAIHLAQWCSPKFAVQVNKFIREWMQGENPLQKALDQWQFYM